MKGHENSQQAIAGCFQYIKDIQHADTQSKRELANRGLESVIQTLKDKGRSKNLIGILGSFKDDLKLLEKIIKMPENNPEHENKSDEQHQRKVSR